MSNRMVMVISFEIDPERPHQLESIAAELSTLYSNERNVKASVHINADAEAIMAATGGRH